MFLLCKPHDFLLSTNGFLAGGKQRGRQHEWARKVVHLCRECGSAEERPLPLGAAARTLGVCPTCPPIPHLQTPAAYLDFCSETSDFAASPHEGRHQLSVASEIDDKAKAWQWTYEHVMDGVRDPRWFRRDSADSLGITFAQLFNRFGDCRFPANMRPTLTS